MFDFPWICLAQDDRDFIDSFALNQIQRLRAGKRRAAKDDQTFLSSDVSILAGYRAEMATARYLGIDFDQTISAVNSSKGDLEFGIEVKATEKPKGNLFCSEKTLRDYLKRSIHTPIVLARVDAWPFVELVGWIFAKDVSRYPFQQTHARHNKGYLVPIEKLQPMIELQNLIAYWQVYNYNLERSAKSPLLTT